MTADPRPTGQEYDLPVKKQTYQSRCEKDLTGRTGSFSHNPLRYILLLYIKYLATSQTYPSTYPSNPLTRQAFLTGRAEKASFRVARVAGARSPPLATTHRTTGNPLSLF